MILHKYLKSVYKFEKKRRRFLKGGIGCKGVARGKGEIPPPRNGKNCCRKMVLFAKAPFLVTNFQIKIKIKIKNFNISIEFSSKKFKNFSKFPKNLRFSTKRAKN